ncbi:helix-hairpin-helix domain-containing protein [Anoxybacteroides amylolyticum]|uniref:Competence ComEA helix-hairpin-helix repeat region domain protein n=1 Tax=Anoxybacteroides amylolyticum TaxID=294699 RepID=A0A160F786_9BACL|nr:helix-hairpin-helix domain-containing protein [Anoxybacillus amylolyticus]ANB61945.1 competence ComEA helix-hairpin-helix repeat region domain protein [Anoxybacillus amylolyticus]
MNQWIKKFQQKWYVWALLALGIVLFLYSNREQEEAPSLPIQLTQATEQKETKEEKQALSFVVVDVKGAVVRPGVYELAENARVRDAIALASGFTKEADQTKVNLAAKVHDEMMIYVPVKGENAPTSASTSDGKEQIDINRATVEEIQKIQGIGPTKAAAIIAYRQEHGPFRKVEDLLNVSGIGEKSLEKMKEQILIR